MFDFTRCNFIRSAAVTNEALVGKPLWPPRNISLKESFSCNGIAKMQSAKLRPLRSLVFEQHPPISKAEKLGRGKRTQEEDFSTSGF